MKLRARGDLIIVRSVDSLKKVVRELEEYHLLGLGANQLLPESSTIPYIKLELPFLPSSYFDRPKDLYTLPASVNLAFLSAHASKYGLKGWEVFTGIPATLGGAIFMNAGTNLGDIGPLIKRVRIVDRHGEERDIAINEHSFAYRKNHFTNPGDVIVEADLIHRGRSKKISAVIKHYLKERNRTQPMKEKTCGCIFKNHGSCRAGHFIDIMGLKGLRHNDVKIGPTHGNFMENRGQARYSDVVELIEKTRRELELNFGLSFSIEVQC